MEQKPLDTIIRDGGMMNIFRSIGCIGDSLASGEFEYIQENGEKGFWDFYDYSWGKQIERVTGISMTNFSRGGLTAYQLYKEADEKTSPVEHLNRLFDQDYAKQGYIIALGVNDMRGKDVLKNIYGGNVGDVKTDIDFEDYNNNKQTFVGCYAKIIQRLKSVTPDAKFFLVTMPDEKETPAEFSDIIRNIASSFDNCYVIDLYHDAPKYDDEFRKKYFSGHMNAMGYLLTAHYIMTYIDWMIRNNVYDFKFVQFIGSGYTPFKE